MKNNPKLLNLVLLCTMLLMLLAACGPRMKFVAPEIEPPADLIPGYVPEGFELIKGYQISVGNFEASRFFVDAEDWDEDTRLVCVLNLLGSFFDLRSPAGNDIQGIHYQDGDNLLLVTKSYYPGGSLELWQAAFGEDNERAQSCDCNCPCGCPKIAIVRLPVLLWGSEIQEVRTIGDTQVAVLDGASGLTTVFVRGDYLLTVESGISLEENLKVVESLLKN